MKVVHAVCSDGFAGVERHIARLAGAQADAGHDVEVIGGDRRRMPLALGEARVGFRPGDTMLEVIRAVHEVARAADVLHVHMTAAELAGSVAAWGPGRAVPIVGTRHFGSRRGRSTAGRIGGTLARRRIRAQLAISRFVADRVEGPSVVVYPGVDSQPHTRSVTERDPVVLVVQRLEAEKRTQVAVDAFARSGLAAEGWRLDIAGDGSLRADLERTVAGHGITEAVRFLGARDDVPDLMARSAILLAPCPIEGLGLSVLEGMAAGLPVVATASGGHLETLPPSGHEVTFRPDDDASAAAGLRRLAEDPVFWHRLARDGQERQRTSFTLEAQVKGTDAVYATVV